jgi:hypothetical protein
MAQATQRVLAAQAVVVTAQITGLLRLLLEPLIQAAAVVAAH